MSVQTNLFAFRKEPGVDPVIVPALPTASVVDVQPLPDGVTTVMVINSYPIWVRATGTPLNINDPAQANRAAEAKDYLLPPYFMGVFGTAFPSFVSVIAVARPGYPITGANGATLYPDAKLELIYGSGL